MTEETQDPMAADAALGRKLRLLRAHALRYPGWSAGVRFMPSGRVVVSLEDERGRLKRFDWYTGLDAVK